jgi:hypothetical protein
MLQEQCQLIIIALNLNVNLNLFKKYNNDNVYNYYIMSIKYIPYIIIEARPSAFLPSINYIKGFIEEYKLKKYLFNSLIRFIQQESSFANINTLEKVQMFWNYFYSSGCMKNKPWEAFIIIDGNWESISFSDEEILYSLLNNNFYNVEEIIEGDEIIEDDNTLNYYISSDDE